MSENMSVAAIVAVVVSLLLEWFPGLRAWFEKFTAAQKQGMMAGVVAVISIAVVLGNCYWWGDVCPASVWDAVGEILIVALLAAAGNQAVHAMTRREVLA